MNFIPRLARAEQTIADQRRAPASPLSPATITTDLAQCCAYFDAFAAAHPEDADQHTVEDSERAARLMALTGKDPK